MNINTSITNDTSNTNSTCNTSNTCNMNSTNNPNNIQVIRKIQIIQYLSVYCVCVWGLNLMLSRLPQIFQPVSTSSVSFFLYFFIVLGTDNMTAMCKGRIIWKLCLCSDFDWRIYLINFIYSSHDLNLFSITTCQNHENEQSYITFDAPSKKIVFF